MSVLPLCQQASALGNVLLVSSCLNAKDSGHAAYNVTPAYLLPFKALFSNVIQANNHTKRWY